MDVLQILQFALRHTLTGVMMTREANDVKAQIWNHQGSFSAKRLKCKSFVTLTFKAKSRRTYMA